MSDAGMNRVMEQIQKLLNLAAKNPNEHEAAAAASKAQELLTKYNLSAATIENEVGADGKRAQEQVDGGSKRFQRELWAAVAELNFCLHWNQKYRVEAKKRVRDWERYETDTGNRATKIIVGEILRRRHALIGRTVNVQATKHMAQYLENAIERITEARCVAGKLPLYGNWAMSFREGLAYRLDEKLREKRQLMLEEEERARKEAEDRASRAGVSLATALTIHTFAQAEDDANRDFLYGEGHSARKAARRAEREREHQEQVEAYTRWAAANPEEARKKEEEHQAEVEKDLKKRRRHSTRDDRYGNVNDQAFWAGHEAGERISLDEQVDSGATRVAVRLK